MKYLLPIALAGLFAAGCAGSRPGAGADDVGLIPAEPGDHHEIITVREPLGVEWPEQVLRIAVEFEHPCGAGTLDLRDSAGRRVPFQIVDPIYEKESLIRCAVAFVTGMRPSKSRSYRLYYNEAARSRKGKTLREHPERPPLLSRRTILKSVMTAGQTSARVLTGTGVPEEPVEAFAAPAPIEAVRGADGVWRGRGELRSPYKVKRWRVDIAAAGPIFAEVHITYEFTEGRHYRCDVSAEACSNWIKVSESYDLGRRSCFVLRDLGRPSDKIRERALDRATALIVSRLAAHCGRGTTIFGLPAKRFETVAATEGRDLFAVFSVEPGRWQNPVGSEINFTRINEAPVFHFPLEQGERRWAIHAASAADSSSDNIFGAISMASDVSLDAVLRMCLAQPGELVLLKDPPKEPAELVDAAESLSPTVRGLLRQGYSGPAADAFDFSQVGRAARMYRRLNSAGQANSPSGQLLRARLAFLGNVLYDPSFFGWNLLLPEDAPPGANFDPKSIDWLRNIERSRTLAEIAAALPDYRHSADWLAHAQGQFALTLKHLVTPWGSWKPGDADHNRACRLLGQVADTLKAAGLVDFSANPAFKAMVAYRPLKK